jgi:hypothetical protein
LKNHVRHASGLKCTEPEAAVVLNARAWCHNMGIHTQVTTTYPGGFQNQPMGEGRISPLGAIVPFNTQQNTSQHITIGIHCSPGGDAVGSARAANSHEYQRQFVYSTLARPARVKFTTESTVENVRKTCLRPMLQRKHMGQVAVIKLTPVRP